MLAGAYSGLEDYEKSNKLVYKILTEMLEWEDAQMLAETVYLLAWSYENEKKPCEDLYIKAFYLSDLFENQQHYAVFKKYYEDNFEPGKQWY